MDLALFIACFLRVNAYFGEVQCNLKQAVRLRGGKSRHANENVAQSALRSETTGGVVAGSDLFKAGPYFPMTSNEIHT